MSTQASKANQIKLELAPPIPGLSFRNYRGEEDFAHIVSIFDAARAADSIRESLSVEELAHYYQHNSKTNPYKDILFAEVNGQPVAYSRVRWRDEVDGPRRYFSGGLILPKWRRKKIGTAMLAHNEARLREIAAHHPKDIAKVFDMAMADTEEGVMALAEKTGYQPVRYFFFMLRPLDEPISEVQLPAGLEVRPATREQMRQIWEADDEAFQDHWGFQKQDEEDYQRWASDPMTDPSLWKVAWDGDEVAGTVLNEIHADENEKLGVKWGWTDPISVRRPWRRRGLARALILESLHMWKAMGFSHAALGVDSQNANGALHLYESTGYRTEERWIIYRKPME